MQTFWTIAAILIVCFAYTIYGTIIDKLNGLSNRIKHIEAEKARQSANPLASFWDDKAKIERLEERLASTRGDLADYKQRVKEQDAELHRKHEEIVNLTKLLKQKEVLITDQGHKLNDLSSVINRLNAEIGKTIGITERDTFDPGATGLYAGKWVAGMDEGPLAPTRIGCTDPDCSECYAELNSTSPKAEKLNKKSDETA